MELGLSVRLRQTVFLASPGENSNLHQILLHKSTVSGTPTMWEAAERNGGGWLWGELAGGRGSGRQGGVSPDRFFCRLMTKLYPEGVSLLGGPE